MLLGQLGVKTSSSSRAFLLGRIRHEICALVCEKKMKIVPIVDEASLLRLEVFSELHTMCQFELDSKPWLPVILAGQSHLIDKPMYPGSRPLASRIVARSHLEGADRRQNGSLSCQFSPRKRSKRLLQKYAGLISSWTAALSLFLLIPLFPLATP
ncbi:MAG: hypothetical protein P4L43_08225 [Syntrophobacteraceae bacterium]|nr:hypothetical protein [Syntrophobacteraceae bacterium]